MDRRSSQRVAVVAVAVALIGAACAGSGGDNGTVAPVDVAPTTTATSPAPGTAPRTDVERLRPEVLARTPHDSASFTQGLVLDDGKLYESAGLYDESALMEVDPTSGQVIREVDLPPELFAEGLELVDGRLVQLTWQENQALVHDIDTFEVVETYGYVGEGWGLCDDGDRLVMSNGSSDLTFRDLSTFAPLGSVEVTLDGSRVEFLNELECVDGDVWANVWLTDTIVRIDPETGSVTATVDAAGLLTDAEAATADVLNGIAHIEDDRFLVTGKFWPWMFEVRFVPASQN